MKAADLLPKTTYTCSPDSTLEDAARLMWEHDIGSLPVLDAERRPVAMITDRDVCMAALTQGVALRDSKVSSAMSKHVVSCGPDTPIADVERLMAQAQVRRIPVVDDAGTLTGIVTLGDIAHTDSGRLRKTMSLPGVARTLSAITDRRIEA